MSDVNQWIGVDENVALPMHSLDSCSDTVMVWVAKQYAPSIFLAHYDYEDGGFWSVQGLSHLPRDWKVTHWRPLPVGPRGEA
jgi:hypothetical protein